MTIEKISTAWTPNYVTYWGIKQALKEVAQNMAYGAVKSGKPIAMTWADGIGVFEDAYIGFEKRHLYIGESDQRNDVDGLGAFGEGWKLALFVMARTDKYHKVSTVGFDAYGAFEDTPHGTKVFVIYIEPNDRKVGTRVEVEVSEEDFNSVGRSFAVLSGIKEEYIRKNGVIPFRYGELWVNGVLVENQQTKNPLDLYYSYNLKDKNLTNRDRTQVNVTSAFQQILSLIFQQNESFVSQYVSEAMQGNNKQDIVRGPSYYAWNGDDAQVSIWVTAITKAHGIRKPKKLVLSSHNPDVDKEAIYRGYKLCRLPSQWSSFLERIGFKYASDVIKLKPNVRKVEVGSDDNDILSVAKRKVAKALACNTVKDLPKIEVVDSILDDNEASNAYGMFDHDKQIVYLRHDILKDERLTVRVLLHEGVHWKTGAPDNSPEFTKGFEDALLFLLGYSVEGVEGIEGD